MKKLFDKIDNFADQANVKYICVMEYIDTILPMSGLSLNSYNKRGAVKG